MVTRRQAVLSLGLVAGLLLAGAAGWSLYRSRTTPHVPYETVREFDGVEIRRYPPTVLAETVAPNQNEAFGRLYRYISGANTGAAKVSMTAPVEVGTREGSKIPMTGPVETGREGSGVRMAFYLPPEYDYETAPRPTDPDIRLVEAPERTLGVKRFSWWPTDARVRRQTVALRRALDEAGMTAVGEPIRMGYDAPGTPPFMRTNEVAVEVRRTET